MESNKSIFATKMEGNILDTSVDNLPYAVSHLDTIITLLASYEDYIVIGVNDFTIFSLLMFNYVVPYSRYMFC